MVGTYDKVSPFSKVNFVINLDSKSLIPFQTFTDYLFHPFVREVASQVVVSILPDREQSGYFI